MRKGRRKGKGHLKGKGKSFLYTRDDMEAFISKGKGGGKRSKSSGKAWDDERIHEDEMEISCVVEFATATSS